MRPNLERTINPVLNDVTNRSDEEMTMYKNVWHHHLLKSAMFRQWIFILAAVFLFTTEVRAACTDGPLCSYLAHQNECELFPVVMLQDCPRACKNPCLCDLTGVSEDTACDCLVKAKGGYCEKPEAQIDCKTTCSPTVNGPCPLLDPPDDPNAHLSTWSTKFLTTVTEICDSGYEPYRRNNKGQKTCVAGGTWVKDTIYGAPVHCISVDCGTPPTSPNTFVFFLATTYGETADYKCVQGYTATHGNATLQCGGNGTWEGDLLQCERATNCNQPPPSSHATVTVSGTTVGETAKYSCETGYEISSGDTTLTCGSTGDWEGNLIVCTQIDCGSPPVSSNSSVTNTDTHFGNTANYTCNSGHQHAQGDTTLTCDSSGHWQGQLIVCKVVDCNAPPAPSHTDVVFTDTTYGHTATYSCQVGYQILAGDSSLTCEANGSWSGTPLQCSEIDCKKPPTTSNTDVRVTGTTYGQTAEYSCKTGHVVVSGNTILTCGNSSSWIGQPLQCAAVDCSAPPTPSHTDVVFTDTTYGHTATYSCQIGYQILTGDSSLTCEANGSWSGTPLQCSEIDCKNPPTTSNTDVRVTGTTYGQTAEYSCKTGHVVVSGDTMLTCGNSSFWIGQPLQCTAIDCNSPPTAPNANLFVSGTTYQHSAKYTCEQGYTKTGGDDSLVCSANGSWLGNILQCSLIDCGKPPSSPHTDVQVTDTTYGQTASYGCQTGYQYELGHNTLTCGQAGKWVGDLLVCSIIDCLDPPRSTGVSVTFSQTTFGSSSTYTCDTGYEYISGDSNLTCDSSGKWIGQEMKCQIKDCGQPDVNNVTQANYPSTTYGSSAVYKCNLGHERVDGDTVRTCLDDKTWSGNALVCLPVVCGPPPVFAGARQWTLSGEGHHTYKDRIHYECFYEDDGREGLQWTMECGPDKVWIGNEPECGAASPHKTPAFSPDPKEAPASWAIGVGIFAILATGIVIFIIMDIASLRKHSKYLRKNLRNFGKGVMKRWSNFRSKGSLKSPGNVVPVSPASKPPTDLTFNNVMASPSETPGNLSPNSVDNNHSENTRRGNGNRPSRLSSTMRTSTISQPDVDTLTPVNSPTPTRKPIRSLSNIRLSNISQPDTHQLTPADGLQNVHQNIHSRPPGGLPLSTISYPNPSAFTSYA